MQNWIWSGNMSLIICKQYVTGKCSSRAYRKQYWLKIFSFEYSTALPISPQPSGAVGMKRRKKKQNEENDWTLRMLMKKLSRRVLTRAICPMHFYFSRNQNSSYTAWAAVSLFARPWKLTVEFKQHFPSLNRCHVCIERNLFRFPVGTPRPPVCDRLISVISDAWFQTQQTRVLRLTVYNVWSWKTSR